MAGIGGKCLCGAVSFNVELADPNVHACHCTKCRRWAGGPVLAVEHKADVNFVGADNVTVYQSSEWAERGFCKICGTALFWRLQGGGHYALMAGTLDDESRLTLASQIFIDEKPAFYDFANDTPKLTGAEVFAQFNAANRD